MQSLQGSAQYFETVAMCRQYFCCSDVGCSIRQRRSLKDNTKVVGEFIAYLLKTQCLQLLTERHDGRTTLPSITDSVVTEKQRTASTLVKCFDIVFLNAARAENPHGVEKRRKFRLDW